MFRKQKERVWKKLKIIGVVLTQKEICGEEIAVFF
jgi:hypothetical protein